MKLMDKSERENHKDTKDTKIHCALCVFVVSTHSNESPYNKRR
jgi:hypothetical protein